MDDTYSFTRVRNALVSLITSIESSESPSYWYNISDNGMDSLCELFLLQDCVFLSTMKTCDLIQQKKVNGKMSTSIARDKWNIFLSQYKLNNVQISMSKIRIIINNKPTRKNLTCIRIGTKSSLSYSKPATQYTHQVLPPLIEMRQLTHLFLNSISIDFKYNKLVRK